MLYAIMTMGKRGGLQSLKYRGMSGKDGGVPKIPWNIMPVEPLKFPWDYT